MEHQDWKPVVLRKPAEKKSSKQSSSAVNQAQRQGNATVVKKSNAIGNKNVTMNTSAAKLENESEELSHERVNSELKRKIQQARIAKKMTQAQLAQAINEKVNIIQDYENGRAIPNQQVLSKMSRILGTSLSQRMNPTKK